MEVFWIYFKLGLYHVLDIGGLDHFYFLVVLTLPFMIKEWEKLLIWVSLFTVGHTISLFSSSFELIKFNGEWTEFLIPITICITSISAMSSNSKNPVKKSWFNGISLIFGIIHGFGFGRYFEIIKDENYMIIIPLLEFALGVEFAQIIIVTFVLMINFLMIKILGLNRKNWQLIISAMVFSQSVSMIAKNWPF